MTSKATTAKSTVIRCWRRVYKGKSYFPLQTFGVCIRYWAFRWQRHSETTAQYQYYI